MSLLSRAAGCARASRAPLPRRDRSTTRLPGPRFFAQYNAPCARRTSSAGVGGVIGYWPRSPPRTSTRRRRPSEDAPTHRPVAGTPRARPRPRPCGMIRAKSSCPTRNTRRADAPTVLNRWQSHSAILIMESNAHPAEEVPLSRIIDIHTHVWPDAVAEKAVAAPHERGHADPLLRRYRRRPRRGRWHAAAWTHRSSSRSQRRPARCRASTTGWPRSANPRVDPLRRHAPGPREPRRGDRPHGVAWPARFQAAPRAPELRSRRTAHAAPSTRPRSPTT